MYYMDRNSWPPHLDSDPSQHKFITTPIPYMSSSVVDIFQPQRGEPNFNTYFQGQYHAEPGTTHHRRIQHPQIFHQTWDVAFFMTSVGPARVHQANIIFDASNGLMSAGDMLHFTYGENDGKYPFAKRG